MPIITCGIFLPNGRFLPNNGDGHSKNAKRFCENFDNLDRLMNDSIYNADEFLICAGCAIVAAYDGNRCFKVASDNTNEFIKNLTQMYEMEGYAIWPYWKIDLVSMAMLNNIILEMPKMKLILKEAV